VLTEIGRGIQRHAVVMLL